MLYTVSASPYLCDLPALLRLVTVADAVLLFQDGVTAAVKGSEIVNILLNVKAPLFALWDDVEARGLSDRISDKIKVIDYSYFVELTVKHRQCLAW